MSSFSGQGMWEFNGRERLEQALQRENVDHDDICLVGSMSLSVRGIREHNDVDVCVSTDCKDRLSSSQLPTNISITKDRYKSIGLSDDQLLSDSRYHDVVNRFKIVRPELTLSYKKYRNRPKDVDDIELLEEYRETADEWDEELYQSLGSGSSASIISRGVESLENDGFVITAIKMYGFLERRYPAISEIKSYLPIREVKTASRRLSTNIETATSASILTNQYQQGEFCAMDVVLWYDLLCRHSMDQFDDVYKCVGGDVIQESDVARLRELQNKDSKAISDLPIRINHRFRILNPNEFAAKLWYDLDDHELSVSFEIQEPRTVDWLSRKDVPATTIERLQQRRLRLLESSGVLFYAILWPPSFEYHDEIERTLASNVGIKVLDSADTSIDDMYSFVHAVYDAQANPKSNRQIEKKIELISEFGNHVRIITLELPNPRIRNGISLEMERIKNNVRHKFVPQLSENLYYSIVHVTDNYSDNKRTKHVVEQYI
jgi:hypothetical protein